MERLTLLASFLAGLWAGRTGAAREELVEPQLAFIPVPAGGAELGEVLMQKLAESLPRSAAEAAVQAVLKEFGDLLRLLERRELALRVLKQASEALEQGRISPTAYRHLARKYLRVLAEVEAQLKNVNRYEVEQRVKAALASALSGKL